MSSVLRDKRIQIAFGLAALEWVIAGVLVVAVGQESLPAMGITLIVLTLIQVGVLFFPRRTVTPYEQAQTAFMTGDYDQAISLLDTYLIEKPDDVNALTLLGNTYRQQKRLAESQDALQRALDLSPQDPFPLYGMGRTVLAQGDFEQAAELIQTALQNDGRRVIRVELALAHYLNQANQAAVDVAQKAVRHLQLEPHRVLMVNYLLHQLEDDPKALPMMLRHADGIAYWQAEAERFADSIYGKRLQSELEQLEALLEKEY